MSHIPPLSLSLSLSLRRAALETWKQKLGSRATYNNLIKVFKIAGCENLSHAVRKLAGMISEVLTKYWVLYFYIHVGCDDVTLDVHHSVPQKKHKGRSCLIQ